MQLIIEGNTMNLAKLFSHETDLVTLSAGQILFKAGEQGELMYVLMSGSVEIVVHDKLVETAVEGAVLGEMAMIDGEQHSATVIAKSDCTLFSIGRQRFTFLVQETPNFALHIMKLMAGRLRKTDASL
jgi:CRP-like cAMP-binding protein